MSHPPHAVDRIHQLLSEWEAFIVSREAIPAVLCCWVGGGEKTEMMFLTAPTIPQAGLPQLLWEFYFAAASGEIVEQREGGAQ